MLKLIKSRQIVAQFQVDDNGQLKTVKTTTIAVDDQGISSVFEQMQDAELYAKNRKLMRKDEQDLRNLRYKIEDEILSELEVDSEE